MQLIIPTDGDYNKSIREFIRFGGMHSRAANKAAEIEVKLRTGLDVRSMTTDHGESRIKNCVKFDLGNGFRLVTVQQGDIVVLLHIGDHDSTDRWLSKNAGLEAVIHLKNWRVEFTVPHAPPQWRIRQNESITPSNVPFLARVAGVEWEAAIPSRATRSYLLKFDEDGDDHELLEVLEELRADRPKEAELCLTVINHLKDGQQGGAQAAVEVYLGKATPVSELLPLTEQVFRAEPNQGRFIILNDLDDAELQRLHDPRRFQDWMLYLHPGQSRVVEEDYDGPALLTGVSGSGKTCVLVHRARRLVKNGGHERVLILTVNQNLAGLIENLVKKLCLDGEQERIVVRPLYDYLADLLKTLECEPFLRRLGEFTGMSVEVDEFLKNTPHEERLKMFRPMSEQAQMAAFEEFLVEPGNPAKTTFDRLEVFVFSQDQSIDLRRYLFEELELVRSAFTCYDDYKGYMAYSRTGRSIVFQENRRQAILSILREWERFQLRRGFLDLMGLTQAAIFAADDQDAIPAAAQFRWVLIDEFQDIPTLGLSLLRRVPTTSANGLFLTGDFAQKIYAKDLDLPAAGLSREQRTDRVIRRNYRNSRQILRAAHALAEKYPPQFGGENGEAQLLEPEYATRETAVPIATQASDPVRAAWQYAQEWLQAGNVPFSVCIASANPAVITLEAIHSAKPDALQAAVLSGDYFLNPQSVVVSDISSVKGFEFSLIIICGLDEGIFPPRGVPAQEHWREALRLYVAITRGRDEARFIYKDKPSPFITSMTNFIQFQTWTYPPSLDRPPVPQTETKAATSTSETVNIADVAVPAAAQQLVTQLLVPDEDVAAAAPAAVLPQTVMAAVETVLAVPIAAQASEPSAAQSDEQLSVPEKVASSTELPEVTPAVPPQAAVPVTKPTAPPDVPSKQLPKTKPATQTQQKQPTPRAVDPMDGFLKRHATKVLNGTLIVPVPTTANEWQLARALGIPQTEVAIECQRVGFFAPPNCPVPRHIVRDVCDAFRCVPNYLPLYDS